eukprot:6174683-Prymnesium_polylepis.1
MSWNVSWESTRPCDHGFGELGDRARFDVNEVRQNILRTIDGTDADVVALQETPVNWFGELADYFDSRGYNVNFLYNPDLFGIEGMTTAWKKSKLDK